MLNLGYALPLPASLINYTSKKDKYLKRKESWPLWAPWRNPIHKKCHKQSKRAKNSLFKLTMAGILQKAEGNLGKTNLLKQTIYWSTNIHILQSPKKPSTIGYQSVGHPELEPKEPNRLGWTRTKRCIYKFTCWAFVVLGDEPVQTRNMGTPKKLIPSFSLFMTS